jgi:hypothetical protein
MFKYFWTIFDFKGLKGRLLSDKLAQAALDIYEDSQVCLCHARDLKQ